MGDLRTAGIIAKKQFEKLLKDYPGSLTATWVDSVGGTYDNFSQKYTGATLTPRTMSIYALIETDKIEYRYAKYGVNGAEDLIAMIRVDQVIPPDSAVYTKLGDNSKYILKNIYNDGNYGTDPSGDQLSVYKIIHLVAYS
jgi:hypothetical protein